MKKIRMFAFWIGLIFVLTGTTQLALAQGGQLPGTIFSQGRIIHLDRTVIHGNIVHYRYDVRVGPGDFDVIRLHRVVREGMRYQPLRTVDGVFLLPGSPNYFEAIFMAPSISPALDWDHSIVAFLAKNKIDVWGMDYGWALVPAETSDFSFMQGWGLGRDIQHTEIALSIARMIRRSAGQGSGSLYLLGFSYGVPIAYSVAGEETQKPYALRNVKGLIPVEFLMKTNDDAFRSDACSKAAAGQDQIDEGNYENPQGLLLQAVGGLAESDPDGTSPYVPLFTNYQFALFVGGTGAFWHFVGALFESGLPTGLSYTEPQVWFDLLQATPPYFPRQTGVDTNTTICNEVDVSFDDHLAEIAVPILFIGAAGGIGERGYYTTTLTSSNDITTRLVRLQPEGYEAIDFGHADLFLASKPEGDAQTLVWQPILNWINDRAQ
jgi:hypothetical protein